MKVTVTMQSGSKNAWPADALTWTSSDTSIATVDSSGLVRAASPGSVSITAVAKQATMLSASSAICAVSTPTDATAQTAARLGAYYFDGWAGPLTGFHFNGLVNGPFTDRKPLSGWQDNNACVIEQQLAYARSFGFEFFVYLWYYQDEALWGEPLNSALEITHSLPNRRGMKYAIMYTGGPAHNFLGPNEWPSAVDEWVSYFTDPDYLKIDGRPLFMVLQTDAVREPFGTSSALANAYSALRSAAKAKGLPDVYIVGGIPVPSYSSGSFADLASLKNDGYDALSLYNYPYTVNSFDGMLPFSDLADAGKWIWTNSAQKSVLPFIPVAMDGWDPRPWDERAPTNEMMYFARTPNDVSAHALDAITWAERNPRMRVEPSPTPPMVILEAWNEIGEGSYILPTVGDHTAYGDAIANMLTLLPTQQRTALKIDETGAASAPRLASVTFKDATANPIAGVTLPVFATAMSGPGFYGDYSLSDVVPAGAVGTIVGYRVNTETTTTGTSDFALYSMSYKEPDGAEFRFLRRISWVVFMGSGRVGGQ